MRLIPRRSPGRRATAFLTLLTAMPVLLLSAGGCAPPQVPLKTVADDVPGVRRVLERVPYDQVRIKPIPIAMQTWTFREFTFWETLPRVQALGVRYLQAYPGQRLGGPFPEATFGHQMTEAQKEAVKEAVRAHGLQLVAYGVVGFEDTEETARPVFEFARQMGIRTIVTEPPTEDFSLVDRMVTEYGVQLAVHNHPEPSTYAHPETVNQRVRGFDPRIGSCADDGHWMRAGLVPTDALRMLEGRIIDVHLKDRSGFGVEGVEDVPFGDGEARVRDILAELTLQDYQGYLTIEHENPADAADPTPVVRRCIDYLKSITDYGEGWERLLKVSNGRYHKGGWNHYGPGYFELDPLYGVLSSHGGMGLFWYAAEKYDDFVLELEFKCDQPQTNSGVFVRVPMLSVSDDYIYHSFEVQIYDTGEGIHRTGAVYDAEAPTEATSKPTGSWNRFRIEFVGDRIRVDLNSTRVVDWRAEPRGKVADFARTGYLGLQNHDHDSSVHFRNIWVRRRR
jgi:sugar phosphate isomerase/epimerase